MDKKVGTFCVFLMKSSIGRVVTHRNLFSTSKVNRSMPKLHGGQSANVYTVQSLKNSIKNKEEFNLERRSSHPKSKTSFSLG